MGTHELVANSLFLDGLGGVAVVPTGPDFYARIKNDTTLGGTMVSLGGGHGGPGKHWEMHPAGEEILVILEGTPTVVFEHDDGREERTEACAGQAVIVPRGVWHRTDGPAGWKILYITYGAGTAHKQVVPS
ncbi:MAG: cupin domain-containing protein [Alphaproteobacteria bacterium]|nr:cupin domain-containing protein [Alphaproteobacteria bacterium]MBL6939996.1 cupin domain-containing protein [Alphaproteobacteria bacterium]MBL7098148.1 cupin domain-containing protein [Alphaproteobacteria bacterium]